MPVVPWVRPSQGSVQAPAKGMASSDFRVMAASATSAPSSQWPVWKPRAMGVPSAARRPPWVLRIRTSAPSNFFGSQPMPAFWLRPKRLPEGAVSSISGVMGSRPRGPGAWVATSSSLRVLVSRTDAREMVGMGVSCHFDCKMPAWWWGWSAISRKRDLHFVTFSCYHRLAYLDTPPSRDLFEDALARMSYCYECDVIGFVVMPEHVHSLVSEPRREPLRCACRH